MKKSFSIILFFGFILLCGAEIGPKFLASVQKESGAVRYVVSAEKKSPEKKKEPKIGDYKKLVKDIDANGA
jgi:hypothetical protein